MRVIELRDDRRGLEAFVVVDHDVFSVAAGGTRMLPDVDVGEVARLARAMTWKFAFWRVPYAGAKAGLRFAGGPASWTSIVTLAWSLLPIPSPTVYSKPSAPTKSESGE